MLVNLRCYATEVVYVDKGEVFFLASEGLARCGWSGHGTEHPGRSR